MKDFRISAQWVLHVPKQLKMGAFEGVFVVEVQFKRHNFVQWELFRGISRHPKDVPFVREFWWGT